MRYQHPDLSEISTFLRDFGLTLAKKTETQRWFKGYGPDPYVYYAQQGPKQYLGGAFVVQSFAELEKAAALPCASPDGIVDLAAQDVPGGGHMVTLTDPEGFPIHLLHGQTESRPGPMPEILATNYEQEKPRVKRFQRFKPGPAAVHKLGHFGLCVEDFAKTSEWYTRTFNFAPTDFLYLDTPDGKKDVAAFMHIDLGPTPVDHHTFFLSQLAPSSSQKKAHPHHSSFEVHDFDSQQLGHAWLESRGYKLVWGVGRHILGSQIFDYWWDTTGFMVEHYADGDLVDEDTEVGWGSAGHESLAVWGPDVPEWFLD
jgi:catechol 2,3-dioxygenase-like lactoylglutathione lyase family enzyme